MVQFASSPEAALLAVSDVAELMTYNQRDGNVSHTTAAYGLIWGL